MSHGPAPSPVHAPTISRVTPEWIHSYISEFSRSHRPLPLPAPGPPQLGIIYSSMSYVMSMGFGHCDLTACPVEVLMAFGDQAAFCNLEDLSCLSSCVPEEWVEAHCICDTGAMFASYSFDFAGETYFCGDVLQGCDRVVLLVGRWSQ